MLDLDRYDSKNRLWRRWRDNWGDEEISEWTQGMVKAAFDPEFVGRKLLRLRSREDVKFMFRAAKMGMGHLRDFGR